MTLPTIIIDSSKCTNPLECKVCLRICPEGVFALHPVKLHKFREANPEEFELYPWHRSYCTMCAQCVENCPVSAITVTMDEGDEKQTELEGKKSPPSDRGSDANEKAGDEADKYNYNLSSELLNDTSSKFEVGAVTRHFAELVKESSTDRLDEVASEVYSGYAKDLIDDIVSESGHHMDRTAEIIMQVADKTGVRFPSIPQRILEIVMLGTRPNDVWVLNECTTTNITYSVSECGTYDLLAELLGKETADKLPCRHLCISISRQLCSAIDMDVEVSVNSRMPDDDKCTFKVSPK